MREIKLSIKPDGTLQVLDGLSLLEGEGQSITRRASHVLPARLPLRAAFRLLRYLFGERGRVAEFTRSWGCEWEVDMRLSDGPACLGRYRARSEALAAERAWLEEKMFGEEGNE